MHRNKTITVILVISILLNAALAYFLVKDRQIKRRVKQLFAEKAPMAPAAPVSYHFKLGEITQTGFAAGQHANAVELPNALVVPPGIYKVQGKAVDMHKEGLYRVLFPFEKNYQVIIYKNELETLLSSLSWIATHGNHDNKLPIEDLEAKARYDKLYLTCGYVTPFAAHILSAAGYKTRTVQAMSLQEKNGYDDAHVMMEVFHPQLNKWILADLDNNILFKDSASGRLLDLVEAKSHIDNGSVRFHYLSNDVSTDISGFNDKNNYSFGLYTETLNSEEMKIAWFRRVLDIVSIDNYFYDARDTTRTKALNPNLAYVDSTRFRKMFY